MFIRIKTTVDSRIERRYTQCGWADRDDMSFCCSGRQIPPSCRRASRRAFLRTGSGPLPWLHSQRKLSALIPPLPTAAWERAGSEALSSTTFSQAAPRARAALSFRRTCVTQVTKSNRARPHQLVLQRASRAKPRQCNASSADIRAREAAPSSSRSAYLQPRLPDLTRCGPRRIVPGRLPVPG